jgi:recombination protein RecA
MTRQLPTDANPVVTPVTTDTAALVEQVVKSGRNAPVPLPRQQRVVPEDSLVPTGATMLNLACSDTEVGGWMLGGFATLPGGSAAGKTVLALTTLAECTYLPRFNDYLLIHDDAEERQSFDLEYLFSKKVNHRISCPPLGNSKTIQAFEANVLTLQKQKKKFIYILDSLDSLASSEELEKEMLKALALAKSDEAAKKIAGSFGMERAKIAGQILRMTNNYLEESQSLIIITQQLRNNVGGGIFDPEYITSGGNAPFFYSNHQVWLTKGGQHKRKELVVGNHVRAKIVKNSATGKLRSVEWDVFNDRGVDDIGSIIDWGVDWGVWKERTIQGVKGFCIPELDLFEPTRTKLIYAVEDRNLESQLRVLVGVAWRRLEDTLKSDRKHRYE